MFSKVFSTVILGGRPYFLVQQITTDGEVEVEVAIGGTTTKAEHKAFVRELGRAVRAVRRESRKRYKELDRRHTRSSK